MCWDCYGGDYLTKKDFRRGKVEVSDFDDEVRYRHTKRRTVKKANREAYKIQRRPGCPSNDYDKHVYVWTTEAENEKDLFYKFFGYHRAESYVCCGCGHVKKSRLSSTYRARKDREWEKLNDDTVPGAPVSRYRYSNRKSRYYTYRYFRWEDANEEYMKVIKDYRERNGWNTAALMGRYVFD